MMFPHGGRRASYQVVLDSRSKVVGEIRELPDGPVEPHEVWDRKVLGYLILERDPKLDDPMDGATRLEFRGLDEVEMALDQLQKLRDEMGRLQGALEGR